MSRPVPNIIAFESSSHLHADLQIIEEGDSVFLITYKDKLISLRIESRLRDKFKYPRSIFTKRGTALRVVNDLNMKFKTNDFKIKEITI